MNSLIIINEKRRKIEMKKAISLVLALVLAVTAAGAVLERLRVMVPFAMAAVPASVKLIVTEQSVIAAVPASER